jgi:hypothetical protein
MENKINLITEIELLAETAEAAVSLNPLFSWAKIVITDDQANANKQRIPLESFESIIKTGTNTPIKMDYGAPTGHKEAVGRPLGVIAHLTKEGNKLIALAALWKSERPQDITLLKDMFSSGNPPHVSWELSFLQSELQEGVECILDPILTGVAIVANPAYSGRTPFIAMSSKNSDTNQEDKNVEELEKVKADLEATEKLLSEKEAELKGLQDELTELRQYKDTVETAKAEKDKFDKIVNKFKESGIEKDEKYFDTNKQTLLSMDEAALDFMIQEMVAFSETLKTSKAEKDKQLEVPPLTKLEEEEIDLSDPIALGKYLREQKLKS